MKIKFIQKNMDVLKQVEKDQSEILFNRMNQYLTDLTESHPEIELANKEIKKQIKLLHDEGMIFKLFVEENKNIYAGYINDKKVYEMYAIEKGEELVELGSIHLLESPEGEFSEYTILAGLDEGKAKLWLGEYDYNYFEKGEENYSLR